MPKPKAVAQAVAAKKRSVPSLLRTANSRLQTVNRTSSQAPPIEAIESKTMEQISDLTQAVIEPKRGPPVHEIHSAYQSAASSLTQSSTFRSMSADEDMAHPKYSNLVYPESPSANKNRRRSLERSDSGALRLPQDKPIVIQRSESSDTMSQQYVVKKRNLVVGIPVEETPDSDLQQQVSPGTDIAIADKTPKQLDVKSPTTQESVVASSSKSSKPSRKIGFKAVKALINRVQAGGSPRKRSSPNKASRKKGTTVLSQREQALLLTSAPNIEETVSGIPVKLQSSHQPVIKPAFSYRDTAPLEPPALTESRSSNDPSPKRASYGDEPPDLTETKSSEDLSVEQRTLQKTHTKSLEPPEWEKAERPRAGSPELNRGDDPPILAKNSRRRGLEPDAVVAFGDRQPVDAPEKAVTTTGPLKIVGIPVDADDISELDDGTRGQQKHHRDLRQPDPRGLMDSESVRSPQALNHNDSSSENAIPISARVARARRASKPINPFDSSSGTSSVDQRPSALKIKTNPFESSDSGETDDDPFDRILLENKVDSMSEEEGIPVPKSFLGPKSKDVGVRSSLQSKNRSDTAPAPSPLREQNRANTTTETRRQKGQKIVIPVQELDMHDGSYVSDLEQSQTGFRVSNVELDRYGADISAMDASKDAQDTIITNVSPKDRHSNEDLALADSISDGSPNRSSETATEESDAEQPRLVMGQLVDDDSDMPIDKGPHSHVQSSFPEKTSRTSNEVRAHHRLGELKLKQHSIGREPVSRKTLTCQPDRYRVRNGTANREDIVDRFFTFIHEMARLSPNSRQKMNQSIKMLPPEAKLIVEAGFEKAIEANAEAGGIDRFYQDEEIELAIENIDWSAAESLILLMDEHKRCPLSKIRQLGGSVASGAETVDASDASELLSELHEFSNIVKGAARRSMKKARSAGKETPKWTKQLIDLTGIDSFRDLENAEAVWLFDLNSSVETPRSDLESLMAFAEKRLGFALDRDVLLTAAKAANPPISSVGALTPQTNFSESPFAALRKDHSKSQNSTFLFETPTDLLQQTVEPSGCNEQQIEQQSNHVEDTISKVCKDAEAILCGEHGQSDKHATLEAAMSNDSNQDGDKYKVNNNTDKYTQALDDKTFEETLLEKDFYTVGDKAKKPVDVIGKAERQELSQKSAERRHCDHDSDVSSSDGLSVILAKIKRDIEDAEESRHTPREAKKGNQRMAEPAKESKRRDFLDILVEATGSLFCGAVDIGNSGQYGGTEPRGQRKKTNPPNVRQPMEDPEDPFSGLELEPPAASDTSRYGSPRSSKVKTTKNEVAPEPSPGSTNVSSNNHDSAANIEAPSSVAPTDADPFESTGSLLHKGPFSPINEQPSAEDENPILEDDTELKVAVSSKSEIKDEVDHTDPESASFSEEDDNFENLENKHQSLEPEVLQQNWRINDNFHKAPQPEELQENWRNNDNFIRGPKPEVDLQEDLENNDKKLSRRQPPVPETLHDEDFAYPRIQSNEIQQPGYADDIMDLAFDQQECGSSEKKILETAGHGIATPTPESNDATLAKTSELYRQEIPRSTETQEATDCEAGEVKTEMYIPEIVYPNSPNSPSNAARSPNYEQSFMDLNTDQEEVGISSHDSSEVSSQGPTPRKTTEIEYELGPKPAVAPESNHITKVSGHDEVPGQQGSPRLTEHDENIRRLEDGEQTVDEVDKSIKDPPPVPESSSKAEYSRVSMIRSKFENQSSANQKNDRLCATTTKEVLSTPEKSVTRFSKISTLRSKFEKRVLCKSSSAIKDHDESNANDSTKQSEEIEEDVDATIASLEAEEKKEDDYETLMGLEAEEKKEDVYETIDLTCAEGESLGQEHYEVLNVASYETESRELVGAVLSGEGMRPESPIFVGEDVTDDFLQPIDTEPTPNNSFQGYHIDLVEPDASIGEAIEEDFAANDGRNSDIAFSLSPSTAASSRVFHSYPQQHQLLEALPYAQQHLFGALPVLTASSSSGEPDQSSQELSISSTNIEGAKHCDIDPNTIPEEIAVGKKSTPRSLMEKHPLPTNLPWDEGEDGTSCSGDGETSVGEDSADLLLALTRSETETEAGLSAAPHEEEGYVGDHEMHGHFQPKVTTHVLTSSTDQDSPARKVASPLFESIQRRLGKFNESVKEPQYETLDAEELFAMLDNRDERVIDVTTYNQTQENESELGSTSPSETSTKRPKANQFLDTIMDRLRVNPAAKRFASRSSPKANSGSVKPAGSSFDSVVNKLQISDKESSDVDDLFQRYDDIVKNMVVLDEERLARVQAKQMASIVMAADSAVDHAATSPQALSEIARRLRRTASERKKEDKVLTYRGESYDEGGDTSIALGSASAASDSSHPSSHARQLRRDLQAALDKSADIRNSQQQLSNEMDSFQAKLNERRSLSAGRSRSLPCSPAKSYYHRNCCASSSESTSIAGDLCHLHRDEMAIPRTISTTKTDMTSDDEDVQNRHLESIRSGLRSSVGRSSPRAKARRRRFR